MSPAPSPPIIRPATAADWPELGDVLGRAFHDDPVMSFVIRRRPLVPRASLLLGMMARLHLDTDTVDVAVDPDSGAIVGAAVWAPPDHWRIPISAYVRNLGTVLRSIGVGGLPRVTVLSQVERRHPREPHQYLAILGTDPAHQGRGVGAALLRPVLDRCDEEGLPAYLESSKLSNVPYYARFGFDVTRELTLTGGPTMYLMWREPRAPLP